eukprot:scpid19746/ scgid0153/ 
MAAASPKEGILRIVLLYRIDRNSSPSDWSLSKQHLEDVGSCRNSAADPETEWSSGGAKPAVCLLRQIAGRVQFVGKYRSGLKEGSFSAWSVFQELVRQLLNLERTSRPLCIYSPKKVRARGSDDRESKCARSGQLASSGGTATASDGSSSSVTAATTAAGEVVLLRSLSDLLSLSDATVLQVAVSTSPLRRHVMKELECAFGITPPQDQLRNQQVQSPRRRSEPLSTAPPPSATSRPEVTSTSSSRCATPPSAPRGAHVSRVVGLFEAVAASGSLTDAGTSSVINRVPRVICDVNRSSALNGCSQSVSSIPSIAGNHQQNKTCTTTTDAKVTTHRNIESERKDATSSVPVSSSTANKKTANSPSTSSIPRLVAQEAHRALVGLQVIMNKQKSPTASPEHVSVNEMNANLKASSKSDVGSRRGSAPASDAAEIVTKAESTEDSSGERSTLCAANDKTESRVEVTVDYRAKSKRSILHRRSFRQKKVERRSVRSVGDAEIYRPQSMQKMHSVDETQLGGRKDITAVAAPVVVKVRDKSQLSAASSSSSSSIPSRRWSSYVEGRKSSTLDSPTSPVHSPHPPCALKMQASPGEPGCATLTWGVPPARSKAAKVLGYSVFLDSELEVTTEGADTCEVQLVELEDGRTYSVTVKSRGAVEDSLPSAKLKYTYREGGSSSTCEPSSSTSHSVQAPAPKSPLRPASMCSQHSQTSVFSAAVVTNRGSGRGGEQQGDTQETEEPQTETMVALQKELRSLLTLSVSESTREEDTTPVVRSSSSNSNTSSSGISAGSWSSSPMQDTVIHNTSPSHRTHLLNNASKKRNTSVRSASPFSPLGGRTDSTLDEVKQALRQRRAPPPTMAKPSRAASGKRWPLRSESCSSALPPSEGHALPSYCGRVSPLSLEWDESYGSHLSATEVAKPKRRALSVEGEEHHGSWV